VTRQGEPLLIVDDPLFFEHRAPTGHPERPERLQAARTAVDSLKERLRLVPLATRDATEDELGRIHQGSYLSAFASLEGLSGHLDADTYYSPRSVAAARRAAGGTIQLAEALMRGEARHGVALVRPPGHHATPEGGMGFCLLNNVAIAAAAARRAGAARVAIVDWDVHHGNGTQDAFYEDPSVLYVSLHQSPFYPGTGAAAEVGTGEGRGTTVNVPLSAGATDGVYRAAFERIVLPILEQYRPDLLLVSAGFDADARDPLAGMRLAPAIFRYMAASLARCTGHRRLGLVLEGGYDLQGIAESLAASLDGLTDPETPPAVGSAEALHPAHAADLDRAGDAQRPFWQLY
jgi:acetoin utilization deacetylase AcuC-like enzyme